MYCQVEKLKSKVFGFRKKKKKKSLNSGSWEVSFCISFGLPKSEEHFKFFLILLMTQLTFLGLPWISMREVVFNVVLGRVI